MRLNKFFFLMPVLVAATVSCDVKNEGSAILSDDKDRTEKILNLTIAACNGGVIKELSGLDINAVRKDVDDFGKSHGNTGVSVFFMQKYPELFFVAEMGRNGVPCDRFRGRPLIEYVSQRNNQVWLNSYLEMSVRQLISLEKGAEKGYDLSYDIGVVENLIRVNRKFITDKTDMDYLRKKIIYSDEVEKPAERLVAELKNCLYRFGGIGICEAGKMPGVMDWKNFRTDYVDSVDVVVSGDSDYVVRFNTSEVQFGKGADLTIDMHYDGKNVNYGLKADSGCLAMNLCSFSRFYHIGH